MKQEMLNRCLTDVGSLLPSLGQQQAELSVLFPQSCPPPPSPKRPCSLCPIREKQTWAQWT